MSGQTPQEFADAGRTGAEPAESAPPDARRRRVLFRATHRGTQENDLLLGGFVAAGIAGFTAAELDALEAVMELPEPDLADFLTGRCPIPSGSDGTMLRAIKDAAAR